MPRVRRYAVVKPMPPTRMILASFAAGVGAMVFLGLIAPTIANGGLSLRTANAEPFVQQAPLIAPLDVPAIKARLALAETSIEAARHSSDPMMFRLERLAHD